MNSHSEPFSFEASKNPIAPKTGKLVLGAKKTWLHSWKNPKNHETSQVTDGLEIPSQTPCYTNHSQTPPSRVQ